jgi:hypothetical protein
MEYKALIAGILLLAAVLAAAPAASAQLSTTTAIRETFLNQDPDPAEPGKYVELRWKLEKTGNGRINDIRYFLDVDYPFSFDPSDNPERNLGDWEGVPDNEDFITLFYKVRVDEDALEGTYKVRLRSMYNFQDSFVEKEYEVRVGDMKRPEFVLGQLTTAPAKLVSDTEDAELDVELANIGDGDAENVVVEMELPDGFTPSFSYSDRYALGTIPAGTSKTAKFFVDVAKDLPGGPKEARMRVTYKEADDDDNEVKMRIINLDIPLRDKPMFEITSVNFSPESVLPGSDVEILLEITNEGGEEADSVTVRAFKESSQPFEFNEKSDFIGKLRPGETGQAILSLSVDAGANEKTYVIDLEIRGVEGEDVIVQERTIDIEVGTFGSQGGSGFLTGGFSALSLLVLVVVAGVVGFGAYTYGKRKSPQ